MSRREEAAILAELLDQLLAGSDAAQRWIGVDRWTR
jgi:hypothetical protein